MPTLYDATGSAVVLGEELGAGGEGTVFVLAQHPDRVAKVYRQAVDQDKVSKLQAMALRATPDLLNIAAWPLELLRESRYGRVVGLVMPRIPAAREVHNLYSPKQRRVEFPQADWRFLVYVARNAAAAVRTVHAAGHVIGDINQKGFLVAKDSTVRLIDCDSFQVSVNGRKYPCLVGVPEFTPPELQGMPLDRTERTQNHDAFGLAVLLFHLLFMGRHPFVGRFQGGGEMPLERAVRELRFAYSQSAATKQMVPPPFSLPLSAASFPVASLFERAFGTSGLHGQRPTPMEWVDSLGSLSKEVIACKADQSHWYHRSLTACPWCEIELVGGPPYFITVIAGVASSGARFDFQKVWLAISQAPTLGSMPTAPPAVHLPAICPHPVARAITICKRGSWYCATAAVVAVILGFALSLASWGIYIALLLLFVGGALAVNPRLNAEKSRRKAAFESAQREWQQLVNSWQLDGSAAIAAYASNRRELEKVASEYRQHPESLRREKELLFQQRQQLQRQAFLDRHYIRNAGLAGIGPGTKAILASEGFETAADLNPSVLNVSGIGPARYSTLISWRASIEARFQFNPNLGINPADLAAVEKKFATRRLEMERLLLQGERELEILRRRAEQLRQAPASRFAQAAARLAQARADLAAL